MESWKPRSSFVLGESDPVTEAKPFAMCIRNNHKTAPSNSPHPPPPPVTARMCLTRRGPEQTQQHQGPSQPVSHPHTRALPPLMEAPPAHVAPVNHWCPQEGGRELPLETSVLGCVWSKTWVRVGRRRHPRSRDLCSE